MLEQIITQTPITLSIAPRFPAGLNQFALHHKTLNCLNRRNLVRKITMFVQSARVNLKMTHKQIETHTEIPISF